MAKKKQSKVSWRKRGAPFEAAALQARQQADLERRTGGSIAGLSDDQLFELQPAAEAIRPKAVIGARTKRTGSTVKKPLWVERVVASNPHISVVVKPPPAKTTDGLTRHAILQQEKLAKVAKGLVQHRAQRALANRSAAPASDALDLWGSSESAPAAAAAVVPKRRRHHGPESSTVLGAVVVPVEGASWNPTHEAHQELLGQAVGHELNRLRRERLHRSSLFSHSDDEDDGAEEAVEGRSGDDEDDEGNNDDQTAEQGASWHVEREKVTKAQRNKRERAREREKSERDAKLARTRDKQLGRVGALLHEIKKEDVDLGERQRREAEIEESRPKKLGGKRHAPRRPEVLLSDEQPTALRQLTAEGSLLADRFDSMQARNLIEVRAKLPRRSQKGPRRIVPKEGSKDMRYKSPFYKGPLPAWM